MLQILACLGVGSKGANEIVSLIIPQGSRNKTIHPVFIFKTVTKTKSSPFPSLCPPGSPSFGSNPHRFWIKKGRSRVSNNELMASDPECASNPPVVQFGNRLSQRSELNWEPCTGPLHPTSTIIPGIRERAPSCLIPLPMWTQHG